jgi:cation-transporting ATPase 13A1
MAVAVNMALMALSKAGIFCTEPYRVPLAGKVSHCLFDKTGTITTDQLVPVGLINYNSQTRSTGEDSQQNINDLSAALNNPPSSSSGSSGSVPNTPALSAVHSASAETAIILAACHSLVVLEDDDDKPIDPATYDASSASATPSASSSSSSVGMNLTGDPIELAAIQAIEWHWDGNTSTASPDGAIRKASIGLQIAHNQKRRLLSLPTDQRTPSYQKDLESVEKEIHTFERKVEESKRKASQALYNVVQVLQRHHFSSALQRMSVVVRCNNRGDSSSSSSSSSTSASRQSSSSSSGDSWYCLVKGSPEALRKLILSDHLPSWYTTTYEALARRGLRVLALAYKKVSGKDRPQEQSRSWVENDLYFGGFIAFECKIRADSAVVIQSLVQSDHKVAMLTGE